MNYRQFFSKLTKISKYKIEITVFISSSLIMIYEIIGSRALAPYFGQSIYIWTGLIGTVMLSLAYGYYVGGRIADRNKDLKKILSKVIFASSIATLSTPLLGDTILSINMFSTFDLRLSALSSSVLLFAPASIFLGIIYPLCYKMKITNLERTGEQFGSLYALSTFGSFFGTLLAGFVLVSLIGTKEILYLVSLILILVSLMYDLSRLKISLFIFSIVVILLLTVNSPFLKSLLGNMNKKAYQTTQYETLYNLVSIKENEKIREMHLGVQRASGVDLKTKYSIFEYSKKLDVFKNYNSNPKSFLVIGGAGYTYPKILLDSYPSSEIHVVEIDGGLLPLAKKYFFFEEKNGFKNFTQDGRVFINENVKKYDVVFLDAYGANAIPFQLTTLEFIQKLHDFISDDGVVIANVISSTVGENSKMLKSSFKTFQKVFPNLHLLKVQKEIISSNDANYLIVASKNSNIPDFSEQIYLDTTDGYVLTDNFAPTELLQKSFSN